MEKFAIGPMLRESVGAALRHWPFLILALVALGAAVLLNTVLITRCVVSPACVPTGIFTSVASNLDAIIWGANRVANWLISGFMIFRILRTGVGDGPKTQIDPPQRRRGFGRCFLYLASVSASYSALDAVYWSVAASVYAAGSTAVWIVFVIAYGFAQISIWSYLDARFAPYIASLACGGRAEGFAETWQRLAGNRLRVWLVFLVLEFTTSLTRAVMPDYLAMKLTARAMELEGLAGIPLGSLVQQMPRLVEFVGYVAVSNWLCAAAMLVVYRRMRAASPEVRAAVFD